MFPADVDLRCEFGSKQWLDAAAGFLQREVRVRPELAHARFVLTEVFTDAPPHLQAPGDRIAWSMRIENGSAVVHDGEAPDADLHITVDYQHILAMGQTVYSAGAAAVARARRELAHRAGGEPSLRRGALPDDPAIATLLGDLHDFLAALTMDNPDLQHRLARLGLSAQAAQLAEQGYCVIPHAISSEFADELRPLVHKNVRDHHPLTSNGLLLRDRLFEEVALHPSACALAQSAVGRGMLLGAMSGTVKGTGRGAIDIHADYPLVGAPYPEYALIAVACWALDDWTIEAGPTWVIPGSHRLHRPPARSDDRSGAVPILMPKGSIALWSHGVWHWQGDRSLEGERVAIHVTYNRVFVRQLDDYRDLDEAAFERNPPAFSTLMGRDDPFGKSSFRGHDGKRFAYAAKMMAAKMMAAKMMAAKMMTARMMNS